MKTIIAVAVLLTITGLVWWWARYQHGRDLQSGAVEGRNYLDWPGAHGPDGSMDAIVDEEDEW